MGLPGNNSPNESAIIPETGIFAAIRNNLLMICLFACVAATISWVASGAVSGAGLESRDMIDFWFNADCPEVFEQMTDMTSREHSRVRRHPFFSLLTTPIVVGLAKRLPITHETIIRIYLAICSAFSGTFVCLIFLRILKDAIAASVWTCLFLTSASFMFWCCVAETHCFAMPTIILPFVVLAYANPLHPKQYLFTFSTLIALSITVTNVMSGAICTVLGLTPRRAIESLKSVICLSMFGVVLQITLVNPTKTGIFFINNPKSEMIWVDKPEPAGVFSKARIIVLGSSIIPQVERWAELPEVSKTPEFSNYLHPILDVQFSPFTFVGKVGVGVWLVLLGLAAYAGVTHLATRNKLFIAITSVALLQLLFHSAYGPSTFVYAGNYGPIFILLSAFAYTTRFKKIALWSAIGLICLQAYNNIGQFILSVDALKQVGMS